MFKVGDKVTVIKECNGTKIGQVYTVEKDPDNEELILWTNKPFKGCTCAGYWELYSSSENLRKRINALTNIGKEAFEIMAEIGGRYTISFPTVPEGRGLYVWIPSNGGLPGDMVEMKVLRSYTLSGACSMEAAYKDALLFIAEREGKLGPQIGS